MIELADGDPHLEEKVPRHVLSLKSDGTILAGSTLESDNPTVEYAIDAHIPIILVSPIHELPFPSIHLDRTSIMGSIIDHL
tara:strand:- start:2410 stop:2652 length:243 start_codon:yes stop_codon:yes gene_type:complete